MPDSTHHVSDVRPAHAEPILGTPIPSRPARPAPAADWLVLRDCTIAAGLRVDMLALRAGAGIAILEIEPRWTPEAKGALERTLAQSGFHQTHPGRLPIIHRRVPPGSMRLVEELVAESFLWQPLPTIAPDQDWVATLRAALRTLPDDACAAPGAEPAECGPASQPRRRGARASAAHQDPERPAPARDPAEPPAALRDPADPLAALRDAVLPLDDGSPRAVATLAGLGVRGGAPAIFHPVAAGLPATTRRTTRFRPATPTWPYRFMTSREVSVRRAWSALLLAGLVLGLGAWNLALLLGHDEPLRVADAEAPAATDPLPAGASGPTHLAAAAPLALPPGMGASLAPAMANDESAVPEAEARSAAAALAAAPAGAEAPVVAAPAVPAVTTLAAADVPIIAASEQTDLPTAMAPPPAPTAFVLPPEPDPHPVLALDAAATAAASQARQVLTPAVTMAAIIEVSPNILPFEEPAPALPGAQAEDASQASAPAAPLPSADAAAPPALHAKPTAQHAPVTASRSPAPRAAGAPGPARRPVAAAPKGKRTAELPERETIPAASPTAAEPLRARAAVKREAAGLPTRAASVSSAR